MDNNDDLSPINQIESMPLDDTPAENTAEIPTSKKQTPINQPQQNTDLAKTQPPQNPDTINQPKTKPETPVSGPPTNALFKSSVVPKTQPASVGNKAVIKRKSRWPKIITGLAALLTIGAGIYFWFFYQVVIKIEPTEQPDKILLNGKEVSTGILRLMPGKNIIEIAKTGYATYRLDRKINPGEKIDLSFSFVKQVKNTVVSAGAKSIQTSYDQKVCYFTSQENRFMAAIANKDKPTVTTELSVGDYKNLREYIISDDGLSGFVLDNEALKVTSFTKSDLVNQIEAKLPPDPNRISSFTINRGVNSYAKTANSKIIYDLKSDYGWSLIYTDSLHQKSEIIMDLTESEFSNLKLDWTNSPNQVLLSGRELGILNLSNRSYKKLSGENNFINASWGPNGKFAVAQDLNGQLYRISGEKAEKIDATTKIGQYAWTDENNLLFLDKNKPIKFNFDTSGKIIYAEIEGLDNTNGLSVIDSRLYFIDSVGLKEALLVENPYEEG